MTKTQAQLKPIDALAMMIMAWVTEDSLMTLQSLPKTIIINNKLLSNSNNRSSKVTIITNRDLLKREAFMNMINLNNKSTCRIWLISINTPDLSLIIMTTNTKKRLITNQEATKAVTRISKNNKV